MDIEIRKATMEDAQDIRNIIKSVSEAMERKELYVADELDFIQRHIVDEGFGLVATDNNKIVAFFLTDTLRDYSDKLAQEVDIEGDELNKVAIMDTMAVMPKYRGLGLQRQLLTKAEAMLKQKGYNYLICTVHPDNCYSLNNFKSLGYEIIKTKEKYSGILRHIMLKTV